MYFERFRERADGTIIRKVEIQTELAEWVEVGARTWRRQLKQW